MKILITIKLCIQMVYSYFQIRLVFFYQFIILWVYENRDNNIYMYDLNAHDEVMSCKVFG